jgi:hypothetical protein
MVEIFKDRNNQFLKVFVDDVNIHNKIGLIICNTFK